MNTITCPFPSNLNPLSPNGFNFSITKLPGVTFFCQQVQLPGITLGSPDQSNPFINAPIAGEILTFDQLQVQFLIDSEMLNYKSIYNWMIALGFPDNYEQYKSYIANDNNNYSELAKNYSDGTLQILTGMNTTAATVSFTDLFPINIGSLVFQATNSDVQYLVGDATFRYTSYKFL
jgi:hypothetical protein